MVDGIVLAQPAGSEMGCRAADAERAEPGDETVAVGHNGAHHRSLRQRPLVGIAALSRDPALVGLDGRPRGNRVLGAPPALRLVDIGCREDEQLASRSAGRAP